MLQAAGSVSEIRRKGAVKQWVTRTCKTVSWIHGYRRTKICVSVQDDTLAIEDGSLSESADFTLPLLSLLP